MKRKALGRGLDALLPRRSQSPPLLEIDLEQIQPNPFQPRIQLDATKLQELAASISENGMIQPILVRSRSSGYEIIAGERRWRAAQKAGLSRVPAIVQDLTDEKMLEVALIENIQREELSPIEEAHAYNLLIHEFQLTQEQVSRRVGRSRTAITNTLRLLRLPKPLQQALLNGEMTTGHARALIPLSTPQQLELADQIASRDLSVREVERRVQALSRKNPSSTHDPDPNLRAAEEQLQGRWKTRVQIRAKGGRGQIIFHFNSEEELDRLYEEFVLP